MSDPITAFLDIHDQPRSGNDCQQILLALANEDRHLLGTLMLQALARRSSGSAFLDTALDLLPDEALVPVCTDAWRRYRDGERGKLLSSVLEFASYQAPQVLQDDWDTLLGLAIEAEAQLASQVWQGLPPAIAGQWALQLAGASEACALERAKALLLAAQPATYAIARSHLVDHGHLGADDWAHWAGVADGPQPYRLHGAKPLHLRFGREQQRAQLADAPPWHRRIWPLHPTWNGGEVRHAGTMGGALAERCGSCHAPLQRLLQTDAAVLHEEASGSITLGLCLDCCGWEDPPARFYRHDAEGLPSCHPSQYCDTPAMPTDSGNLMPAGIGLAEMDNDRWRQQDWGQSNHRQNLSRVGGAPSWVQSAWYPACIDCSQQMPFVMQLDSTLPTTDRGMLPWGSGGMLYTFWCGKCRVSAHFWQCT